MAGTSEPQVSEPSQDRVSEWEASAMPVKPIGSAGGDLLSKLLELQLKKKTFLQRRGSRLLLIGAIVVLLCILVLIVAGRLAG